MVNNKAKELIKQEALKKVEGMNSLVGSVEIQKFGGSDCLDSKGCL